MAKKNTREAGHEPIIKRNMLTAPKVPLAIKPKPVAKARFLIAGTTGRDDYTGSLTVSPSSWPVTTQLNSLHGFSRDYT